MRFIDPADVQARLARPEWRDWTTNATAAYEKVEPLSRKERAEAINRKQKIWSEIRPLLAEISNGKCWYCETKEIRSDKPVDHFRPKNSVAEDNTHPGYWWLAFNPTNYRFGCTYCNSFRRSERTRGGKQDKFPLLDETKRVRGPGPLDDEEPVLLDPFCPSDVLLLTFDANGDAIPSVEEMTDKNRFQRAKDSIDVYHLNHPDIQEMRWQRMNKVREHLATAKRIYKLVEKDNPEARRQWDGCLRDLLKWQRPTARFSAATLAELNRQRDNPLAEVVRGR